MKSQHTIVMGILSVVCLGFIAGLVYSAPYGQSVVLQGPVKKTVNLSGFPGEKFVVGLPNSQKDDYAIYGFTSEERRDNPCYVTILTENVNDSAKKLDTKKNLCGGKEKSREMKVKYSDSDHGQRAFVSGVQVCMNNKDTRVKGLKIRGKTIDSSGNVVALQSSSSGIATGGIRKIVSSEPSDKRPNCNKNWKKWAQCDGGSIATSAILHFDAGKTPRALTGIELNCRRVTMSNGRGVGAVRAN